MQVQLLKSKIHRATVTDSDLHYEGSIGIARDLMDMAGLRPYEQVDVANIANGARFTTYVIEEPAGSGAIVINGAAAHLVSVGDLVIIMCYGLFTPEEADAHKPRVIRVGEKNKPVA
jgi:aspartate 1-decarboxylase